MRAFFGDIRKPFPIEDTITAAATDEDGTFNANSIAVEVYAVPETPILGTPWISGDPEVYEGRNYTLDLHANEADLVSWLVNWGDGSISETVSGTAVNATHLYADGDEICAMNTPTMLKEIKRL